MYERRFQDLTTLRCGGAIKHYIETDSQESLIGAITRADEAQEELIVIGAGSNLLASDETFDGCVIRPTDDETFITEEKDSGIYIHAQAGCIWDSLVEHCVREGLSGLEALSAIPGKIGSAVMQNIGAYGQELSECFISALLWDRKEGRKVKKTKEELQFGYRSSVLRKGMGVRPWHYCPRYIVLEAVFRLLPAKTATVRHPQLAGALGCTQGSQMMLDDIRKAIIDVRTSKAMVPDPDPKGPNPDYDRWSSGSFFTNPILQKVWTQKFLPPELPCWPTDSDDCVKVSAAWLIEHAGFPRGFGIHGDTSAARISTRHCLALTNRGQANAADIAQLARTIKKGVLETFGVELSCETVLVGIDI